MTDPDNQNITGMPARRRRKSKYGTVATIILIVIVGAGIGWGAAKYLTSHETDQESSALITPRPKPATSVTAADNEVEKESRADASAKTPPPPLVTETVVDSYGATLSYPIDEWTLGTSPSGFIDRVTVNGRPLGPEASMPPLRASDILELSGWTGDVSIGLRYPYVLISACNRVVAHTAVDLQRPDVAKAVHEYLVLSGWRVTIAATHLPQCEGATLRGWGVAPGDRKLLLPLNRRIALSDRPVEQDPELRFTAAAPPLHAGDMPPIAQSQIKVRAKVLNMRRCARSDCAVTGQLAEGTLNVLVLGETADWMLVVLPGRAGWVSKQYAEIANSQR